MRSHFHIISFVNNTGIRHYASIRIHPWVSNGIRFLFKLLRGTFPFKKYVIPPVDIQLAVTFPSKIAISPVDIQLEARFSKKTVNSSVGIQLNHISLKTLSIPPGGIRWDHVFHKLLFHPCVFCGPPILKTCLIRP